MKWLDYLADAFAVVAKQRPDVRLVVAGGNGGYQATFEKMIAGHGLTDRTHLVGPLYGEQKLDHGTTVVRRENEFVREA